MPAEVRVFTDAEELGDRLADHLLGLYTRSADRPFLLGCPGGRSLRSTYRALAARKPDLGRLVVLLMMDEYVVDGRAASANLHYAAWPASVVHDVRDGEIWLDRESLP